MFVNEISSSNPSRRAPHGGVGATPGPVRRRSPLSDVVSPAQQALRELLRTNAIFRGLAETHFATYGVSLAQWSVLRALSRLEGRGVFAPHMNVLCAEMVIGAPSLSATLALMERTRHITRAEDPKDKRAKIVSLAPAGRQLLERRMTDHLLWVKRIMAGLNRREQRALALLLAKASKHMHEVSEGPQRGEAPPVAPRLARSSRRKFKENAQ